MRAIKTYLMMFPIGWPLNQRNHLKFVCSHHHLKRFEDNFDRHDAQRKIVAY